MSKSERYKTYSDLAVAAIAYVSPDAGAVSGIAKAAWDLLCQRSKDSEEIMVRELRDFGAYDHLKDKGEFLVRAIRYRRAATVGAAHDNLRILARLVVRGGASHVLTADHFMYLAQVIESLRYEEMVVLAAFIRARRERLCRGETTDVDKDLGLFPDVKKNLEGTFSEGELLGYCNALLRTGFLYVTTGWGGGGWHTTETLDELENCTQFEQAVSAATMG